jgi:hypothetical protein
VLVSRWAACCCLTSHPSGRLRRRLIPALGVCLLGSSSVRVFGCALTFCISLRQALLTVRGKSSSFKAWGLWQVVFVRQIAVGHAMLRPQIPNNSFKRNAAVQRPLNSSVRQQSIFLLLLHRLHHVLASHCVAPGWPAFLSFACKVVSRISRASAYLASSCSFACAAFGNTPFIVSILLAARRPQTFRHCWACKAAVSCLLAVGQHAAV